MARPAKPHSAKPHSAKTHSTKTHEPARRKAEAQVEASMPKTEEAARAAAAPKPKPCRKIEVTSELLAHAQPQAGAQMVDTFDADGRVLLQAAVSPLQVPPQDNSAMDGYAVRIAECADGAAVLPVSQRIPAGTSPEALAAGSIARIFTGAPVPAGADAIVMQEDCELLEDGRVRIKAQPRAGQWIRRAGEDIVRGALVLPAGTPLGPAELGVLASIAHATPLVHPAPEVAFLNSGDELADLDRTPDILSGRRIASSNSYTLHALIRRAGAVPRDLGLARDTEASLREHFARAAGAHLLVTTAGVSVGEHDLVSQDLLIGILAGLEKQRWMFDAQRG